MAKKKSSHKDSNEKSLSDLRDVFDKIEKLDFDKIEQFDRDAPSRLESKRNIREGMLSDIRRQAHDYKNLTQDLHLLKRQIQQCISHYKASIYLDKDEFGGSENLIKANKEHLISIIGCLKEEKKVVKDRIKKQKLQNKASQNQKHVSHSNKIPTTDIKNTLCPGFTISDLNEILYKSDVTDRKGKYNGTKSKDFLSGVVSGLIKAGKLKGGRTHYPTVRLLFKHIGITGSDPRKKGQGFIEGQNFVEYYFMPSLSN
jgi:hypothetical protein